jgi:DNA topoisomerase VI subunit A
MFFNQGLVAGDIQFYNIDGTLVDCSCSISGESIPQNIDDIFNLSTYNAKMVLLVEKDATFQKLVQDRFITSNAILVTAKGMPDLSTRFINQFVFQETVGSQDNGCLLFVDNFNKTCSQSNILILLKNYLIYQREDTRSKK